MQTSARQGEILDPIAGPAVCLYTVTEGVPTVSTPYTSADSEAGSRDSLTTVKLSEFLDQLSSSALAATDDLVDLEGFFLEPPAFPF